VSEPLGGSGKRLDAITIFGTLKIDTYFAFLRLCRSAGLPLESSCFKKEVSKAISLIVGIS
jgi:hypothetical protein